MENLDTAPAGSGALLQLQIDRAYYKPQIDALESRLRSIVSRYMDGLHKGEPANVVAAEMAAIAKDALP